jgi:hypothetical protein
MLKITKGLKTFIEEGVSTYTDDRGNDYVRVKIGDEDFCIAPYDYTEDDDDAFKWNHVMTLLEAEDLELPTKQQVEIYKEHIDDINDRLKEIGGEALKKKWYWTSTEHGVEQVWAYMGDNCHFNVFPKNSLFFKVRTVINLQ